MTNERLKEMVHLDHQNTSQEDNAEIKNIKGYQRKDVAQNLHF